MMLRKGDKGGCEEDADSGEDEWEESVNRGEDWLVVGDEAEEVEAMEVTLPLW